MRGTWVLSVGLLALASCAPRAYMAKSAGPKSAHLQNVPFYPNNTGECGPSSLASVLNYWGKDISVEQISAQIYLPKLKGTFPLDMLPTVQASGLSGAIFDGSFADLKQELDAGRPVVAYLNFGTRKRPIGHFVVVTGYDDDRKGLYIHSGTKKDKFASYVRFDRGWKDTNRWMLVAAPKESGLFEDKGASTEFYDDPEAAVLLSPEEYVQLGSYYESQGQLDAAEKRYRAALKIDKNFEPALMHLGNFAFNKNDLSTAETCFRRVLKKNPAHGGANNNLAMVYLTRSEHLDQAERLAKLAAQTDYRPYANDTLAQIYKARSAPAGGGSN